MPTTQFTKINNKIKQIQNNSNNKKSQNYVEFCKEIDLVLLKSENDERK